MNDAYAEIDGKPHRVLRAEVNLGIAVDVPSKDGARTLVVPNIKNAGRRSTSRSSSTAFDDLVSARAQGRSHPPISRARPSRSPTPAPSAPRRSVPRLMPGQGAIIATGAIDYPGRVPAWRRERCALLGISKVMTVTCTYDHRIIQGAESGLFLAQSQELLEGRGRLLRAQSSPTCSMPHQPVRWEPDREPAACFGARRRAARPSRSRRGHAAHQRLPRARPPHRRSRSARAPSRAPHPRARPVDLRPHHLGPRPRVPHRRARRGDGEGAAAVHAARDPRHRCATPTAARSASSTCTSRIAERKRWLQQRMEPDAQRTWRSTTEARKRDPRAS